MLLVHHMPQQWGNGGDVSSVRGPGAPDPSELEDVRTIPTFCPFCRSNFVVQLSPLQRVRMGGLSEVNRVVVIYADLDDVEIESFRCPFCYAEWPNESDQKSHQTA